MEQDHTVLFFFMKRTWMDFCFWVTAVVYLLCRFVFGKDKYTTVGATVVTQDRKSENVCASCTKRRFITKKN